MKHYEVVFLVHPDQSEQVPSMIEKYVSIIKDSGGNIHRQEDWGRKQLAYPINNAHKAHYVLLNIECNLEVLEEIKKLFKFNYSIMRNLITNCDSAVTTPSPYSKKDSRDGKAA